MPLLLCLLLILCAFNSIPAAAQKNAVKSSPINPSITVPNDFNVSFDSSSSSKVLVNWTNESTGNDYIHRVYYYDNAENYKDISADADSIDDLTAGKRYEFQSVNMLNSELSSRSPTFIVDLTPDIYPPQIPRGVQLDNQTLSFITNNKYMIDIYGYKVYCNNNFIGDTTSDTGIQSADISHDVSNDRITITLNNSCNHVSVSAYDWPRPSSNESEKSPVTDIEATREGEETSDTDNCFIATAAFGSLDHPLVKVFRQFRDKILLNYPVGKELVNYYYKHGPKAAKIIENSSVLKILVIILLLPALAFCYLFITTGPLWGSTISIFSIAYSIIFLKWLFTKK